MKETLAEEYSNNINPVPSSTTNRFTKESRAEYVYKLMMNWCQNKKKFTLEDLEKEFMSHGKKDFDFALEKMEDGQAVGNMGEYYEWID